MKVSARNQLLGVVKSIKKGPISALVTLELPGGQELVAQVTVEAVKELGLKKGVSAIAIVKASHVILGVE
jgi:molybdate transport system regulatory protein